MNGPRWPDVVDALVALLPTIWDVRVFDGEPVMPTPPLEYAAVGWAGEDSGGGADQELEESGARTRESGEVKVTLVIQTGNTALAPSRKRAFDLLGLLQRQLAGDRTLGGVFEVDSTYDMSYAVASVQNTQGSAYQITITVRYLVATMLY